MPCLSQLLCQCLSSTERSLCRRLMLFANNIKCHLLFLSASHPFWRLWQRHLQSLTQPGSLFEGVIDSLVAILLGDPLWKETSTPTEISRNRSEIRSLLIKSPPNVIILKNYRHYGCHERCSPLWNYICVSKRYVKLWVDADEESKDKDCWPYWSPQ